MKTRAVISTPFPSVQAVASEMRVPKSRVRRLIKLMHEIRENRGNRTVKKKTENAKGALAGLRPARKS